MNVAPQFADKIVAIVQLPIVSVLVGALIAALTSYFVARRQLSVQSEAVALKYLTDRDERILEILGDLGPAPVVTKEGKITEAQDAEGTKFIERVFAIYFENIGLIDPLNRQALHVTYTYSLSAHMLYQCFDEPAEFKKLIVDNAALEPIGDLAEKSKKELMAARMMFCMKFRDFLISEHDDLQAAITDKIDLRDHWKRKKYWMWGQD